MVVRLSLVPSRAPAIIRRRFQALAERPNAPVIITEGGKAADAAGKLLPGQVAVTSPNGSKSLSKAD
jgi:hypothetical protein